MAGFTGAILGLPQGVAFAILAGLPPEYGLYAAMVPPALSALFGSSCHMVAGPTNAVAILLFASLALSRRRQPGLHPLCPDRHAAHRRVRAGDGHRAASARSSISFRTR